MGASKKLNGWALCYVAHCGAFADATRLSNIGTQELRSGLRRHSGLGHFDATIVRTETKSAGSHHSN